jgi:hypothetical protein
VLLSEVMVVEMEEVETVAVEEVETVVVVVVVPAETTVVLLEEVETAVEEVETPLQQLHLSGYFIVLELKVEPMIGSGGKKLPIQTLSNTVLCVLEMVPVYLLL